MYRVRWTRQQQLDFAIRWLKFRERYGVSQGVMAELLGISVATVNRIERAKFIPRDETVVAFAELEQKYREGRETAQILTWVPGQEPEI